VRKLIAVAALLAALVLPIGAAASDPDLGTLKGVVYDTTCYGPCRYPPPPPQPYAGDNLVVRIRSLPDERLVATLHPIEGRFRIALPPGPYRVRALVRDSSRCWEGEVRKVKVIEDQTTAIRLSVHNACIV
jgi:hypothetical protein